MKYFVHLNEFTLWRILWLVSQGRPIYLMPSSPIIPLFSNLLRKLQTWLEERPNVQTVYDLFPSARPYFEYDGYAMFQTDLFLRTEKAMDERQRFHHAHKLGAYDMAYKQVACNKMTEDLPTVLLMNDIAIRFSADEAKIITTDKDSLFIYEAYHGQPVPIGVEIYPQFVPVLNFLFALSTALYSIFWIVRRLQLNPIAPREVFLGADFVGAQRQVDMVRDLIDDPASCLFVFRSAAQQQAAEDAEIDISGFETCQSQDGRINALELFSYLWLVVESISRLYFHVGDLPPAKFLAVSKLPFKKVFIRALLSRYRFRYFWGRDDYRPEHILRTQELRDMGSVSLGIAHGLPSPEVIQPIWRYIDFDIYYVLGRHLYEEHYSDTWSKQMYVRPVGSLGMTLDLFSRIDRPRLNNIVFFVSPSKKAEMIYEGVADVARAFPDRKVFVKIKISRKREGYFDDLVEFCRNGPENLIETEEDSYELMLKARHAISGSSTITAEAIQFGLNVYSFDLTDEHMPCYYREFPGLCVRSGEEIIENIRAIENGSAAYPRHLYAGLINLSGEFIIDIIRKDMNLSLPANGQIKHPCLTPENA